MGSDPRRKFDELTEGWSEERRARVEAQKREIERDQWRECAEHLAEALRYGANMTSPWIESGRAALARFDALRESRDTEEPSK